MFSTGGSSPKTFAVRRDGNKLFVGLNPGTTSISNDRTIECKTVAEAKRLMHNPASICE